MNKKILVVLCILAITAGVFTLSSYPPTRGQTHVSNQTTASAAHGTRQSPRPASAPEQIVYRQFLHHLMALKERAGEIERQGKNGKSLRSHYKDEIGLNDEQANILDQIAADCDREVAALDARAKKIIDAAHARYSNGIVSDGQQLPPPPPELRKLQEQREMIIMRARYRLRTALGEHGFQQIDDYIKLNFAKNIKPAQLSTQQLASPQPPGGMK